MCAEVARRAELVRKLKMREKQIDDALSLALGNSLSLHADRHVQFGSTDSRDYWGLLLLGASAFSKKNYSRQVSMCPVSYHDP